MDIQKLKRLENSEFSVGSTRDFLKLSSEEVEIIELKILLEKQVKQNANAQSYS